MILIFALLVLGAIVLYAPQSLLRDSKKLTGKELAEMYSEFAWVRWGFPVLYVVWVLLVSGVCWAISGLSGQKHIYFIGVLLPGIAMFNGLFALVSGVCPVPLRYSFLYVYEKEAHRAGLLQVLSAFALILIAVALDWYWSAS